MFDKYKIKNYLCSLIQIVSCQIQENIAKFFLSDALPSLTRYIGIHLKQLRLFFNNTHFFQAIVRSEKHNRTETNTRMFLNTQQSFKCIAWMWTLSRYSRSRCENSSYAETNGKINKLFTHGGKGDIYLTTPPLESKPSSSQKRASINQY